MITPTPAAPNRFGEFLAFGQVRKSEIGQRDGKSSKMALQNLVSNQHLLGNKTAQDERRDI